MDIAAAFTAFKIKKAKDLKSIAEKTHGELSAGDLESEAWLIAEYHSAKRGFPIDWADPQDQKLILATLTVQHVWRDDGKRKSSVSVDQDREDQDGDIPTLIDLLPSAETDDPLVLLERREEEESENEKARRQAEEAVLESYSQSAAYIIVLWHFDNTFVKAAAYLVVHRGTLTNRIAFAAEVLKVQPSLFDGIERLDETFMPKRGAPYPVRVEQQYSAVQWGWEF